jgi:fatty acid CoA ligase FadD22
VNTVAPDADPCISLGNIASRLAALARHRGWHDHIAFHIDGATFTFAQVHAGARRAAAGLVGRGVRAGSHVVIALPGGIELVWTVLGALRIGAVAMPLDPVPALRQALPLATPGAVTVGSRATVALLPAGTAIDVDELTRPGPSLDRCADVSPESGAYASWVTRGARGPRWVFHNHGDPLVVDRAMSGVVVPTPQDVTMTRSGTHTSFELGNSLFLPLLRGTTTVVCGPSVSAADALGLMRRHAVTVLVAPPSFYSGLLDIPDRAGLSALRVAVVGGEDLMDYPLELRLREELGDRVTQVLSPPESRHVVWAQTPGPLAQSARGRTLRPYRARVVDRQGREAPVGIEGRLEIADTTVRAGSAEERLPAGWRPGGRWHRTGHRATADEDGTVWIHGPAAATSSAPEPRRVRSSAVERLLAEHPAVQAAAVDVQHLASGPRVRACVTLKPGGIGATALELLRLALLRMVHRQLGAPYVPRDIVFVRGTARGFPHRPAAAYDTAGTPPAYVERSVGVRRAGADQRVSLTAPGGSDERGADDPVGVGPVREVLPVHVGEGQVVLDLLDRRRSGAEGPAESVLVEVHDHDVVFGGGHGRPVGDEQQGPLRAVGDQLDELRRGQPLERGIVDGIHVRAEHVAVGEVPFRRDLGAGGGPGAVSTAPHREGGDRMTSVSPSTCRM